MSVRTTSSKLIFYDIVGDNFKVQIMASKNSYKENFSLLYESFRRGDVIGVEGSPMRTKAGELSIKANSITGLSYCLH